MNRLLSVLSLALLTLSLVATPARPDEDDKTKLEFVRRLRERHMSKLALDYLEQLKQTGSDGLKKVVPVEIARTKISMARELEPDRRKKLFEEARQELEAYAKSVGDNTPEAAQARLEKARVATYEAQALLSSALRQEDRAGTLSLAAQAEDKFIKAGAELDAAAKAVPDADKLIVKFEKAKNLLDQAQAVLDPQQVNRTRRAKLLDAAREALEAIEKEAGNNDKAEALHLARAWLYRVYKGENLDATKTKFYLNKVTNSSAAEAVPGQRVVHAFQIQNIQKDPDIKETGIARYKLMQKEAKDWLKTYRGERNSTEGFAVRMTLAKGYLLEAQETSREGKTLKDAKKAGLAEKKAEKLFDAAHKEFTELAAVDNDYQDEANLNLTTLGIRRLGDRTVEQLKDADECFLKARYELFKMQEAADLVRRAKDMDKRKELEKQKTEHENNVLKAFTRGIDLAEKTPTLKDRVKKVGEARYYLTYVYLLLNNSAAAAELGEKVARAETQTKYSAATAGYAIEAYTRVSAGDKAVDEQKVQEGVNARKKLYHFADFIQKERKDIWKNEPIFQVAIYQQAMVCLREKNDVREKGKVKNDKNEEVEAWVPIENPAKKFKRETDLLWETIHLLGKLSPEFRGYHFAQCQQAYTALLGIQHVDKTLQALAQTEQALVKDPKKVDAAKLQVLAKERLALAKERTAFQDTALKLMKSLKPVTADTDASTTQMYFSVQFEQGNMLFRAAIPLLDSDKKEDVTEAAKRYTELGDFTARMRKEYALAGNRLSDNLRDNFGQAMTSLENRYRHGMSQLEYRAGNFDKVLGPALTGGTVELVKKLGQASNAEAQKFQVALKQAEAQKKTEKELDALRQQLEEARGIVVKDERVTANMLGNAMRANVQVGKVPEALEILDLLQRLKPEKGAVDLAGPELETFIRELKGQVKTLTEKKDTAKLKTTTENISLFLDKMMQGKSLANLSQKDRVFMANSYASLNKHAEAIKLLDSLPRPMIDPAKKYEKMDKKEKEDLQQYWLTQVLYGHALRMDKKLPKAKEVLTAILEDPQSLGKFLAQKEINHLEEDAGRFGNAISGWGKFLTNPNLLSQLSNTGLAPAEQRRVKVLYFEGYYHLVYSNFMFGKNHKMKEKTDVYVKRAVDKIQQLEKSTNREGWDIAGPRIVELISNEPLLLAQPGMKDIVQKAQK